jgi:CHAT domain-containing protein
VYEEADASLTQAIDVFAATYPIEAAHCLIDLAWSAMNQGHVQHAHRLLEQADGVFYLHDLPLRRAICAHNMSIEQLLQGEFAQALYHQHLASQLFAQTKRDLDVGSSAIQLGKIYLSIGHWNAAAAQFSHALTVFNAFGAAGRLASCAYNLTLALLGQGALEHAQETLAVTERYARQHTNQEILFEIAPLRAKILALRGQVAAADSLFDQAGQVFLAANHVVRWARCRIEQGLLALHGGRPAAARPLFEAALAQLDDHLIYQWPAVYGQARCAESMGEYGTALTYYEQAITIITRFRRQLVNEHLSSIFFAQVAELFRHALTCARTHHDTDMLFRLTEQHRTLTLQRLVSAPLTCIPNPDLARSQAMLADLTREGAYAPRSAATMAVLEQHLNTYAEQIWLNRHTMPPMLDDQIGVDVQHVRQRCHDLHGHDWTIVSFLLHEGILYINMLTPDAVLCRPVVWNAHDETLIEQLADPRSQRRIYHDVLFTQGINRQPWQPLEDLGAVLFPVEVQQRLHPDHRLYVIPSGILHAVSWGTLRVGGAWLCDIAIIQVIPHWLFLTRPVANPSAQMLQLGCSDFEQRAEPLPLVRQELDTVAAVWGGSPTRWLDAACTVTAVCDPDGPLNAGEYGVLHIASHAYMTRTHGLAGHIMLSDGNLWIDQITRLRLKSALVVMSPCSGAVVDTLPAEENISLSWSWLIAGAKGVIASLWPMPDGDMLPVLELLYAYLAEGQDAASALTLAQRTVLNSQSPVVWGKMVIVGYPMTAVLRETGGTRPVCAAPSTD